jgi:DNA-binding transcriptional LysR family regulator
MKTDLRRLNQILMVARTQSFSRASKQLAISQPALSRSIAILEAELDVRIFDRGRGGVALTPAGRALIAEAEQLISRANMFEQNAARWRSGYAGVVAFGIEPVPASAFLPKVFVDLASTHPRLVVRSSIGGPDEIVRALEADSIEFGICAEPALVRRRHLERQTIGKMSYGLFVRAGHPLLRKKRLDREDLARFPVASGALPASTSQDNWLTRLCVPNFVCESFHILKDVMLTSDVIWLTSPLLLGRELRRHAAFELQFGVPQEERTVPLCAVRLAKRSPSDMVGRLIQMMSKITASECDIRSKPQ